MPRPKSPAHRGFVRPWIPVLLLAAAAVLTGADGGPRSPVDWLLDIDREELPHGSEWRTEFHWLPQSWEVFAVLGAGLACLGMVAFLYIKEATNVSPFRRIVLAGLRLGALAVAFAILIGPNLRAVHHVENDSVFLILVDTSASMKIQDKYLDEAEKVEFARMSGLSLSEIPETARIELVNRLLAQEELRLVPRLAARNDLRIYGFDRDLRESATVSKGDARAAASAFEADGLSTDLSSAILEVLERQEGNTEVAGILLVTDGQFNQGPPPYGAAKVAGNRSVPIWVVGLGDVKSPRSLSLLELLGPDRVFVSDPDRTPPDTFQLTALVQHRGMKGRKADLVLERAVRGSQDFGTAVDKDGKECRKSVAFEEEGAQPEVRFEIVPEEIGEFEFRLRIDDSEKAENPLGPDVIVRQATMRKTVRVIDRENKILMVSGTANYEFRILKNLLIRDKEMELALWLQSATKGWPQKGDVTLSSLETALEFENLREYDLVILIDVNPRDVTEAHLENLEKFLTREGGGLIFVCGEAYTHLTLTDPRFKTLLDILPVIPDADPLKEFDLGRGFNKEWRVAIPEEGEAHEVLQLAEDPRDTRDLVASLLPFYWYFPVVSEKPLARKLLVRIDPQDQMIAAEHAVMMAFGFYGPGRVLFLATDSTYLWRSTNEAAYNRFWLGAIRYLIEGRLFGGQKRATITISGDQVVPEGERYAIPLGGRLEVRVDALDSNFVNPLEESELQVEFQHRESKDRWTVSLQPIEGRPGEYRGSFHPALTGQHVVSILGFSEDEAGTREVVVREPRGEIDTPELNRAALASILQLNREGRLEAGLEPGDLSKEAYVEEHMLDRAEELERFPDRVESKVDRFQILGKRQEIWSSPAAILLFVLLVGLEWFFRKRSNLV